MISVTLSLMPTLSDKFNKKAGILDEKETSAYNSEKCGFIESGY
jgi:hypothetical protein